MAFNRTSLGLKRGSASMAPSVTAPAFNRTSLGLKRLQDWNWTRRRLTFNRTSLGLKLPNSDIDIIFGIVLLIEPVWDWNPKDKTKVLSILKTFNRTSLGLKRLISLSSVSFHHSAFNRTSLGLKHNSRLVEENGQITFNRTSLGLKPGLRTG